MPREGWTTETEDGRAPVGGRRYRLRGVSLSCCCVAAARLRLHFVLLSVASGCFGLVVCLCVVLSDLRRLLAMSSALFLPIPCKRITMSIPRQTTASVVARWFACVLFFFSVLLLFRPPIDRIAKYICVSVLPPCLRQPIRARPARRRTACNFGRCDTAAGPPLAHLPRPGSPA